MRLFLFRHRSSAFTVADLMIVIVTVALMAGWYLQSVNKRRRIGCCRYFHCSNNLKQVGLAFRMWSNDHQERFPWMVSTNEGGTKEFSWSSEVFRHYETASNELNSPKILVCSSDTGRIRANCFASFASFPSNGIVPFNSNINLSYFVGLDADETEPSAVLAGDRSITTNHLITTGILTLTSDTQVAWANEIHQNSGNIAMSDGSVVQLTNGALAGLVQRISQFPARLAIP